MGHSTARMASSNTVLRPFWVRAEHSRYLVAPTSLAMDRPYRRNKVIIASENHPIMVGNKMYTGASELSNI